MKRWVFFGRVLPERLPLKISDMKWSANARELGVSFDLDLGIADGQVLVIVSVTKGDPELHSLRNLIKTNISVVIDAIGYLEGLSFDIDMISAASLDTGDRCIFGTGIPVLQD